MAKTKGANSFTAVSLSFLREHVSPTATVPVSRIWLRNNNILPEKVEVKTEEKNEERIAFTIHK